MKPETWYLLIHRVPAKPLYLRARVRALLLQAGAVALKNSVYARPQREGALEGLQSVAEEIRRRGGEAFVCEARFTDPADEASLVRAVREHKTADYRELAEDAEALVERLGATARGHQVARASHLVERLRRTITTDDFGAAGRKDAEVSLRRLERAMAAPRRSRGAAAAASPWAGRTWVTRRGVHVDRIACAWLVRRFLDPSARIRFVGPGQVAAPGEVGFDLPGGEFTHEGGGCSLESLIARTGLADPALARIAGIVHDIDVKDGRFGFPETAGIERLIGGVVAGQPDDEARLTRGAELFDDLYRSLRKPAPAPSPALVQKALGRKPGRP